MRTLGAVALAAIVSWGVAMAFAGGAILLGFVVPPGPHVGFALVAMAAGMAIVAIGTAVVFLIVMAVGGQRTAIRWAAIVLMVILLLVLAAPAIFGALTTDPTDVADESALAQLISFAVLVAVPALAAILIQWWWVARHLRLGRKVAPKAA